MDYTQIISTALALIVAIAEAFLIPWLKNKYDSEKLAKLLKYVEIGVNAAEQLYDVVDGEAKKQYVIDYLAKQGIKFDEATVDNAIEAAVLKLHNDLQ